MKRKYILIIIVMIGAIIFTLSMIYANGSTLSNLKEEKIDIQYHNGVVLVNGEPKYLDPNYLEVPELFISVDYVKKLNGEIVKAGILRFLKEPKLSIYDVSKSQLNLALIDTRRELMYKVENCTLYISENGTKWDEVYFRVVNDKPHKDKYDSSIIIYWVVYLECPWFKGEYEIIGIT